MNSPNIKLPIAKSGKTNRLFLIGNGFDISLGLKTKYTDFLLWLLKKEVIKAVNSGITKAPFPKYKGSYDAIRESNYELRIYGFSENELFDVLVTKNYDLSRINFEEINNLVSLHEILNRYEINIKIPPTNLLMSQIFDVSKENWVDIENIYFELLKKFINVDKINKLEKKKTPPYKELIDNINEELTYLSSFLKEYLITLEIKISKKDSLRYFKHFNQILKDEDFMKVERNQVKVKNGDNYFLNFNYTDSVSEVLKHFENYHYIQNFIHGNLKDEEIIFGFGDEMDSIYKEIEELNDNRFFKHIKSFHYFKRPNLRQLLTFLNSGDFQVCIYGHSCGLSDRVMLNEIFEHENCKSIKIYYYNDEDFTTKTMEISRHFKSNQVMRKKIVDKSIECLIPQIKSN